jgi:hypothetical protein
LTSPDPLFRSFFMAGFECSTHRNMSRRRLDMIAATHHDMMAYEDYAQLGEHGIRTARDGVRWNLIETSPGQYDWSSVLPMIRAGERAGCQVIWDLCHYGWPDDLDVFSPAFVDRFAPMRRPSRGCTGRRRAARPSSARSTRSPSSPSPAATWSAAPRTPRAAAWT